MKIFSKAPESISSPKTTAQSLQAYIYLLPHLSQRLQPKSHGHTSSNHQRIYFLFHIMPVLSTNHYNEFEVTYTWQSRYEQHAQHTTDTLQLQQSTIPSFTRCSVNALSCFYLDALHKIVAAQQTPVSVGYFLFCYSPSNSEHTLLICPFILDVFIYLFIFTVRNLQQQQKCLIGVVKTSVDSGRGTNWDREDLCYALA